MSDPGVSDEELKLLTRAYLNRRTGRTPASDLEDRVMRQAVSRRMRRPITATVATIALVLAGALMAVVVLAFHDGARTTSGAGSTMHNQVRIMRTSGGISLPPLDRTIADPQTVNRLAADIHSLPILPANEHCPSDLGTLYTLMFVQASEKWTAVIHAQGCEAVQLSTGQMLWAVKASTLWNDLAAALGLSSYEVNPIICVGATPGVIAGHTCVPQS